MSFEEKTCGAGLEKLWIIMVYYSLSSIYWFSWGEPSNQWPLPAARAAPTWAFLGLDPSRPSFWNRLLRSIQEVHSLHLGSVLGCFSTWSVLTFNLDFIGFWWISKVYTLGPRIFPPTGMRWTEQLTHSIISRPAPRSPRPNSSGTMPYLCHTDVVAMMKINAVVGYTWCSIPT